MKSFFKHLNPQDVLIGVAVWTALIVVSTFIFVYNMWGPPGPTVRQCDAVYRQQK